jgi:ComF family protein
MELDELSGRVIVLYKDSYERRLSSVLADYLLSALPAPWLGWADVLTWIPVDRKALRRRGFDHMEMIVQDLAERTGLRAQRLLDKQPTRDQRGLTRSERYENLQESFRLHDTAHALPQHILLIDDVLTTGATLDAASSRLKEGGAVEVRVACVARAW